MPDIFRLQLIRKLLPGDDLGSAGDELEKAVRQAVDGMDVTLDLSFPASRDDPLGGTGYQADPNQEAIRRLQTAVRAEAPDRGRLLGAPYWSEAPMLAAFLETTVVYCAPGDIANCHTFEEHVMVEEYLSAIRAYANFIVDVSGHRASE